MSVSTELSGTQVMLWPNPQPPGILNRGLQSQRFYTDAKENLFADDYISECLASSA